MRTTADALNELVNGSNGLQSKIDSKLSQTTADTLYLGKTAKAASAATADAATTAATANSANTANTATSAGKVTGGTVQLTGAITGSASFNSSGNLTIATDNGTISGGGDATQSWVRSNFLAQSNATLTGALTVPDATKIFWGNADNWMRRQANTFRIEQEGKVQIAGGLSPIGCVITLAENGDVSISAENFYFNGHKVLTES